MPDIAATTAAKRPTGHVDWADHVANEILVKLIDADLERRSYLEKRNCVASCLREVWNQGCRAGMLQRECQADHDDAVAADDWATS